MVIGATVFQVSRSFICLIIVAYLALFLDRILKLEVGNVNTVYTYSVNVALLSVDIFFNAQTKKNIFNFVTSSAIFRLEITKIAALSERWFIYAAA